MARRPDSFGAFYTREAHRYEGSRYGTRYGRLFGALHAEALTAALNFCEPSGAVLEVACGTGHTTNVLASLGTEVVACDLTPAMMQFAAERCQGYEPAPSFVRCNAKLLPFADATFSTVVSSRFLHLFSHAEQRALMQEMRRVIQPGGYLVVDFDNWFSRWILSIPYLVYNLWRYRRLAPYGVYNRVGDVLRLLPAIDMRPERVIGIGGTHLVIPALASEQLAMRIGRWHQRYPGLYMAEQFLVVSRRIET